MIYRNGFRVSFCDQSTEKDVYNRVEEINLSLTDDAQRNSVETTWAEKPEEEHTTDASTVNIKTIAILNN